MVRLVTPLKRRSSCASRPNACTTGSALRVRSVTVQTSPSSALLRVGALGHARTEQPQQGGQRHRELRRDQREHRVHVPHDHGQERAA